MSHVGLPIKCLLKLKYTKLRLHDEAANHLLDIGNVTL